MHDEELESDMEKYGTSPEETQEKVMEKMKEKTARQVEKHNLMLERLKVEYVTVDFLKPNAYNPNRQSKADFELLCLSMKEDGFTQPVLALKNGIIIDGEHRWRAAMKLGYQEIPVVFTDMTPEQMRISTLRHNRARGSEDVELTAALLRDLEKLGAIEYAKKQLMLTDDDMAFLLEGAKAADAMAAEQYSQAWEQVSVSEMASDIDDKMGGGLIEKQSKVPGGTPIIKSYTTAAAERVINLDKKLQGVTSPEEREAIKQSRDYFVYRVSFMFAGEEAQVISQALGKKKPSERFFRICEDEYHRMVEVGLLPADLSKYKKPKKKGALKDEQSKGK